MAKSTTEKRISVEEQIKQLEKERKLLIQKERAEAERAKKIRFCNRGVVIEKLLPHLAALTDEQFENFLKKTLLTEQTTRIIADVSKEKPTPKTAIIVESEPIEKEDTDNE